MIRPTPRGFGFTLIVLAVYFFAGQTQIGWLYVMVAGGLAWIVLSLVIPLWSLSGVRLQRQLATRHGGPAVEDEPLRVRVRLETGGRTSRRFLRLIEECPVAPPNETRLSVVIDRLPARVGATVDYETVCYLRGVYEWPPARLESSGPLGLFQARRRLERPTSLVVLPPVYRLRSNLAGSREEPAPAIRPRRGPGLDLFGTREYQQGDALHQIHWRSTARHREIIVREFEEPRRPSLAIWIDNAASFGRERESSLEYAVKLAASVGSWALRAGYAVLLIDRDGVTACQTSLHLRQVLAQLPLATAASWPAPGEARRAKAGVILRAAGSSGAPPEIPQTIRSLVWVGLTGFEGQPSDLPNAGTLTIGAGSDLARGADRIAGLLGGSDVNPARRGAAR